MANLIPSYASCVIRMQAGERRFARRIGTHLEDDYLCWYEVPVGKRQRYPDFILLHPARGLLLLEVKDWRLDSIQSVNRQSFTLKTSSGGKSVTNPLEQARQCAYQLVNQLETDPQLVHPDGRYKGKLVFAFGYGVVLSRITRQEFQNTDLGQVLPEHQVICQDEMQESTDPEQFQKRLWDMMNIQFGTPLSLPRIDRIRWHLFPEIRIANQIDLFDPTDAGSIDEMLPDIVKVMDTQQELLARSLGDGHRVIHGVAGSGKTLILGYRCLYLAEQLNKPILVLCYNITLAARLREMVIDRGVEHKVSVYHFHDWCGEQLRLYHIERPAHGTDYFDRLVTAVIDAADKGTIPKGQYGAVMIDEGHDFEAHWLQLVVDMVDPETNSLLFLYDDAQSIYNRRSELDFSLASVGVSARGRTTILKLNYRNTDEILHFAYQFASHYFSAAGQDQDSPLLAPEAVGRHGPPPIVRVFANHAQECRYIASVFRALHQKRSLPWADMCVTYRSRWMGENLSKALAAAGVPCQWLSSAKDKKAFRSTDNSVKLMTMHSSKGLEFPVVAVSGIGYGSVEDADLAGEAKLLYVAMTRSTDKLLVTCSRQHEFVDHLLAATDAL